MFRRSLAAAATAAAASVALTMAPSAPASAAPDALRTYVLPGRNVFPYGISVLGGDYYVSSAGANDTVYRGDLRERRAKVFITGARTSTSTNGIKATATHLIVTENSGGPPRAVVYNRLTGQPVARFSNGLVNSFLNMIAVAPNGDAYLTDAAQPVLYRIPAGALARHRAGIQPLQVFRNLRGTAWRQIPERFNASGIVATSDGKFLLVINHASGELFRVRLGDREVTRVDLQEADLTGSVGMVLTEADVLYIARDEADSIAEIRLAADHTRGRLASETHHPSFQSPSDVAIAGDRLLVTNTKFDPGTPPFTVSGIPLP